MLKDFRILQSCTICGDQFDSNYKLMKHMSKTHPETIPINKSHEDEGCSCGHTLQGTGQDN